MWSKSRSKLRHLPTVLWENLFLLVFCQGFKSILSMQSRERAFPSVTKLSSFWLSASWHSASSTCSGAASSCCSFHTMWGSGSAKGSVSSVPIPSWWCAVCSPLPAAPSAGNPVFQPVSLPQGRWLMSQPQRVAPDIEDWADVPGALVQTGPANLSLLCHHECRTSHGSVTHHLWAWGLLFWSHLAISVCCILWLLVLR